MIFWSWYDFKEAKIFKLLSLLIARVSLMPCHHHIQFNRVYIIINSIIRLNLMICIQQGKTLTISKLNSLNPCFARFQQTQRSQFQSQPFQTTVHLRRGCKLFDENFKIPYLEKIKISSVRQTTIRRFCKKHLKDRLIIFLTILKNIIQDDVFVAKCLATFFLRGG